MKKLNTPNSSVLQGKGLQKATESRKLARGKVNKLGWGDSEVDKNNMQNVYNSSTQQINWGEFK